MRQGTLGWVLLAVVLAIPAFLFYRWKSGMQNSQSAAISAIAKDRVSPADIFGKSPNQIKFKNPLAATMPATAAVSQVKAAAPAMMGSAKMAQPVLSARVPALPAAVPLKPGAEPATYALNVARDPTLSADDLNQLKELRRLEAEREWRLRHPSVQASAKKKKVHHKPSIETTVRLEGIIYAPGNAKAIINDLTIGEGGHIGEIRVVKIGPSSVIFSYKNKQFVKTIKR